MAKKSRTPPPPRRPVQAPKVRTGAPGPRRPRWPIAVVIGGLGLVALAVVLGFVVLRGPAASEVLADAGCTLETFPGQGRAHVQNPPKKYNSFPPTSGPHNPTPAPFDVYEEPVEPFRLVHNLEHGAVIVQYGSRVPQSTVAAMVEWYRKHPNGIVIAPLPALVETIALEAWNAPPAETGTEPLGRGILAKCKQFDEDAFDAFVEEYGFKGPERFPRESLAPGA